MIELPRRPFPPTKALALECLARGPLVGSWNGEWRSPCGAYSFNTHTVHWLTMVGLAMFNRARTEASITRAGQSAVHLMEVAE